MEGYELMEVDMQAVSAEGKKLGSLKSASLIHSTEEKNLVDHAQVNKLPHKRGRRWRMKGFVTVYVGEAFELLRAGDDRYFLKLTNGLSYAAPGLTRLTKLEAEKLLQEHIKKDLILNSDPAAWHLRRADLRVESGIAVAEDRRALDEGERWLEGSAQSAQD